MKHAVHVPGEAQGLTNVLLKELKARLADQMSNIVGVPRDQVVNGDNLVTGMNEAITNMRADKAGCTRNDISHALLCY